MSTPSRRERIQALLQDEPRDTFLRYSLALEWEKEGDSLACMQLLDELTRESPPYVPAFFMAAQHLVRVGEVARARGYLRDGIEEARRAGDAHAAAEMSEFLQGLGRFGEG